jgi:hypothetical protein
MPTQMHMFSDMVTDPENVMLRGRELCEYFQRVVSDEGAMTHPITARHLTFDGEVVSSGVVGLPSSLSCIAGWVQLQLVTYCVLENI